MGIWKYKEISKLVPLEYQLTLSEGQTRILEMFMNKYELKEFGIREEKTQKITLKLETENPNNSFKDRSLAFQISHYLAQGKKKLLISSSGNAAVSAAKYVSLSDMKLAIFASNHINSQKLEKLNAIIQKHDNIFINFSAKPKSDAIKYSRKGSFLNLRGSSDPNATYGFKSLAYELIKQVPKADALFIPCSSGTSTVGIFDGYNDHPVAIPQINICQTTKVHPIAKDYDVMYEDTKTSLADAIVDRVAKRKEEVQKIIKATNGGGWVISDELIQKSIKFLQDKTHLENITSNGVLSFAGYLKARKAKKRYANPICIISGI